MDQQAKSTFTGIMAAVGTIVAICLVGYGIYYAATGDQRRKASFERSLGEVRCLTDQVTAYSNYRSAASC